jgi:hypothetical protein
MQFLAICRRRIESFPAADLEEVLGPEADAIRAAYAGGAIRDVRSRGDVPGTVMFLEAVDVEAAWALVESLPLFQRGMLDADVIPLLPFRGFVPG